YFGGIDGLSYFDPAVALREVSSPDVVITQILINNRPVSDYSKGETSNIHLIRTLDLGWNENSLGLQFTAIDFKYADKLQFQYKIDDTNWFYIGDRRSLELLSLAPGSHIISIRSRLPGGHWSQTPRILSLEIQASFWKRPYVIAALGVIFLLAVLLIHRTRIWYLKRANLTLNQKVEERTQEVVAQNEELRGQRQQLKSLSDGLERKVDERTKEIQMLNEGLRKQYMQLEQFSFINAHVIRGPVSRIQGLVTLSQLEGVENTEVATYLDYIRHSADTLDDVIRDMNTILNLKKAMPDELEKIDLKPVLDHTLQLLKGEAEQKKVSIDTRSFASLSIKGTLNHLQSIFFNLLENAIKYTDQEKVPILQVTCKQVNSHVQLEFIDNGLGIDMSLAANKIFTPYQRFHETASGKGLGLYLVKTQVEILGGSVGVASAPGQGSTFSLSFPR
ncbi:MAG: HAMP domain-containing sensor histidine kinase, partial [Imperialibacter sp.]